MTNGIEQYLRAVRRGFPFVSRRERVYLRRLHTEVTDCFEGWTPYSMEAVSARFGAPEEVVESYLDSLEPDYLLRRIRIRERWRRAANGALAVFAAACVLFVASVGKIYADYCYDRDYLEIGYAIETIEIEEGPQ